MHPPRTIRTDTTRGCQRRWTYDERDEEYGPDRRPPRYIRVATHDLGTSPAWHAICIGVAPSSEADWISDPPHANHAWPRDRTIDNTVDHLEMGPAPSHCHVRHVVHQHDADRHRAPPPIAVDDASRAPSNVQRVAVPDPVGKKRTHTARPAHHISAHMVHDTSPRCTSRAHPYIGIRV